MGRDNHSLWCTFARCCTVDTAHKSMNTFHMGLIAHLQMYLYVGTCHMCYTRSTWRLQKHKRAPIPAMYSFMQTMHFTFQSMNTECTLHMVKEQFVYSALPSPRGDQGTGASCGLAASLDRSADGMLLLVGWGGGLLSRREFVFLRFWNYKKLFESPQIYFYGEYPTLTVIEK